MNAATAYRIASEEMTKNGLVASGWELRFVPAREFAGATRYGAQVILISSLFVGCRDRAQVLDVIRHEIAHALVGVGHAHDAVWEATAKSIGCSGVQKVA